MVNNIILSICISTYNRAEILERTLSTITNDVAFDDTVEIVIGDNGSTDNTCEISDRFRRRYSNIRYYKNESNINTYNFTKVLSEGKGIYLKFLNDTQILNEGTLGKIKKEIISYQGDGVNLIFANSGGIVKNGLRKKCMTATQLMNVMSFYTTWSGNFGMYKVFFDEIKDKDRCSDLFFPQVDWIYRVVSTIPTVVITDKYYKVTKTLKKGAYNFLKVFTDNYLKILRMNVVYGWAYEKEKYRLYTKHLVPYLYYFYFENVGFEYLKKGGWIFVLRRYFYYPYFYLYTPFYFFCKNFIWKAKP